MLGYLFVFPTEAGFFKQSWERKRLELRHSEDISTNSHSGNCCCILRFSTFPCCFTTVSKWVCAKADPPPPPKNNIKHILGCFPLVPLKKSTPSNDTLHEIRRGSDPAPRARAARAAALAGGGGGRRSALTPKNPGGGGGSVIQLAVGQSRFGIPFWGRCTHSSLF